MEVLAAVTARLEALGYKVTEADYTAIRYQIAKAETELRVKTNRCEVPDGLFSVWVDMAAGLFLLEKKAAGGLSDLYDFDAPAKSISEGDTSVTFALSDTATLEEQFDASIEKMTHPDAAMIVAFRRLTW